MKKVSFEVAKAIKEAGYPQIFIDCAYYEDNKLHHTEDPYNNCRKIIAYAPTYLDVWLWLWREKRKQIELQYDKHESNAWCEIADDEYKEFDNNDPEEAIITAIEYLVENDLIK